MSAQHKRIGDAISRGIDGLLVASIVMLIAALAIEGLRGSVWLFALPLIIAFLLALWRFLSGS